LSLIHEGGNRAEERMWSLGRRLRLLSGRERRDTGEGRSEVRDRLRR